MKMPVETLIAACITVFAIEAMLHWFPWNRTPFADRESGELGAPWTYIVGLAPILLAYTAWICQAKPHRLIPAQMAITGIVLITSSAGAAVIGANLIDRAGARYWRRRLGELDGSNDGSSRSGG
jgi:hypothetical membrane protein